MLTVIGLMRDGVNIPERQYAGGVPDPPRMRREQEAYCGVIRRLFY